jgi:hypothetical protein
MYSAAVAKRIFSYEEAAALLPEIRQMTGAAVDRIDGLPEEAMDEQQRVVEEWAASIMHFGIEVKGLWLIDFDNGSGYYCWKYPEPSLQFFHGYDEGFGGRVKLQ